MDSKNAFNVVIPFLSPCSAKAGVMHAMSARRFWNMVGQGKAKGKEMGK